MPTKDERIKQLTDERDRYLAYIQDEAVYSPYTGTKKNALQALDLRTPLIRATPMKK